MQLVLWRRAIKTTILAFGVVPFALERRLFCCFVSMCDLIFLFFLPRYILFDLCPPRKLGDQLAALTLPRYTFSTLPPRKPCRVISFSTLVINYKAKMLFRLRKTTQND